MIRENPKDKPQEDKSIAELLQPFKSLEDGNVCWHPFRIIAERIRGGVLKLEDAIQGVTEVLNTVSPAEIRRRLAFCLGELSRIEKHLRRKEDKRNSTDA